MWASSLKTKCLIIIALLTLTAPGLADQDSDEVPAASAWDMSVDEIAKELSNPVNALFSIANDFEYRSFQGDLPESGDQSSSAYFFKPSFPIPLSNGKNILIRATIPIVTSLPVWKIPFGHPLWILDFDYPDFRLRQSPHITADTGAFDNIHGHLGDIGFDVAYGGVSDNGFISMYGIATQLDTSTNMSAGRGQVLLGPEIALGKETHWGIYGAWMTHLVNVTDSDYSYDTNETYIEVFFAYGLGNGWQIFSTPKITYDWEADSGNDLLLPIGAGVSKTTKIGRMPLKLSLEIQKFVVSSDRFGTDWLATFSFTPVFRNPFRK